MTRSISPLPVRFRCSPQWCVVGAKLRPWLAALAAIGVVVSLYYAAPGSRPLSQPAFLGILGFAFLSFSLCVFFDGHRSVGENELKTMLGSMNTHPQVRDFVMLIAAKNRRPSTSEYLQTDSYVTKEKARRSGVVDAWERLQATAKTPA